MEKSLNISSTLDLKNYLILFILWPFLALITAILNFDRKEARKVVYIYLIYYGLTFVVGEIGGAGPDAERQVMRLLANAKLPLSEFFAIVGGLYDNETSVDVLQPLVSFLVSRFTTDHGILFAVYASIFGLFYLMCIKLLYDQYRENPGYNALIHLIFFVFIIPVTSINGFRMWTAAWIFFYGAYHVVLNRDARYLLVSVCASLVHFSFLSVNAILLIYYLAGNRNVIYFPIALISFVLPGIMAPVFQTISFRLGGALQARYEGYSSENYMLIRQEDFNQAAWFLRIGSNLVLYYLLVAIFVIQVNSMNRKKENREKNLYSFILLFLAFVNFGKVIPSLGDRFLIVFFLFATLYVFCYFLTLPGKTISWLTLAGAFPMLLFIVLNLRIGSPSINAWILMPGMGLPLFLPELTLFEVLFQ